MRPASLREAARAMGAELHGAPPDAPVHGVASDSRAVREGELFFALAGTTDGAAFAPDALARGAVAAVAPRPLAGPTLVVPDPLRALQDLARWSLRRPDAPAPTVVGITGSVGKTTTKDALAAILRAGGAKVSATVGNYNNEIGLPLTVLAARPNTEILVLEMGATHAGNIAELCRIAPPRVGVLTAIAPAHLESFGSLEALAATKGELAAALPETGAFVSPAGVPDAAIAPGRTFARRIVFSGAGGEGADLWASHAEDGDDGLRFVVYLEGRGEAEVRSPVFGTHLVEPLLAAVGGAVALGMDLEDAARGLARLKRSGMRGDLYRLGDDVLVYDDSYNAASPTSMAAVLRYGAEAARRQGRRLVVVLGGMLELGSGARAYHREIGALAAELGVGLLVCVGDEARWYAETFGGRTLLYTDSAGATGLGGEIEAGDYVVVKGSRGARLENLTRDLKESLALV